MSVKELRISDKSKQTLEGEEGKDFFSLTIQIESWSYDIDLSKEELDELKDNYFAEVKPRKAEPAKSQPKAQPADTGADSGTTTTPRKSVYTGLSPKEKAAFQKWLKDNDLWTGVRPSNESRQDWEKAAKAEQAS